MDLEKLAQLLHEDVEQKSEEVQSTKLEEGNDKVASSAEEVADGSEDEETMKIASELFAMGDIMSSGFVNHLVNYVKQANNPSPDAGDGSGGKGSVAKAKGDALPQNAAPMPADETDHKLKETGLKNTGPKVSTKGDSQGKGMGEGGGKSASDEKILDRLAKALRK